MRAAGTTTATTDATARKVLQHSSSVVCSHYPIQYRWYRLDKALVVKQIHTLLTLVYNASTSECHGGHA